MTIWLHVDDKADPQTDLGHKVIHHRKRVSHGIHLLKLG